MLHLCNLFVLKGSFLLPCWRPAFPFLRFFVSQLEPTRNLTPTYNSLIQIHHFSNFPEFDILAECHVPISAIWGRLAGNIHAQKKKTKTF